MFQEREKTLQEMTIAHLLVPLAPGSPKHRGELLPGLEMKAPGDQAASSPQTSTETGASGCPSPPAEEDTHGGSVVSQTSSLPRRDPY